MKRLLQLVKPHWKIVAVAAFAGAIVSAMNGALAWVVQNMVDDVFIDGNHRMLVYVALGIMGAIFLRGLFTVTQNILMASVGAKVVRDLRTDLYSHMVYLPMSHYGTDTTGSMMSKVINDIGFLDQLLVTRIKEMFLASGTIIVLSGVAFYRRWDLTLIALVALPFAFSFVIRIGRRIKKVSHMAQMRLEYITESLTEGLGGIKVVKAFTMEEVESRRFADKGQGYYREYMKMMRLSESSYMLMECVGGLGVGFIIYYGGSLVVSGELTSGEFFSFIAAIMMIYHPAKQLSRVHNGLQQARAYVERVDGVLAMPGEPEGDIDAPRLEREISFSDVRFRYKGRNDDALRGVELKVNKGEVIALVGKSGSGKTTLVDLLARFYQPQKGVISFDGVDINNFTTKSLRSQIGIVSQNVMLFNGTVRDNISYGAGQAVDAGDVDAGDVDENEIIKAAEAAHALDFIEQLPDGFDTEVGDSGSLLSGGQRQRISIARAIVKDPAVLILDEATSALDTESEMMVQKALDELMESAHQKGSSAKTVFVIAHRLSTIKRADRIVVLDRGQVVEVGSHDELLKNSGVYEQLYRLQYGQDDI